MASPEPVYDGADGGLALDHPSRAFTAGTARAPANPYSLGLRIAWWGRVSTEELQDPTLSLPRQLSKSRAALPAGSMIVAHFYDVESGRKDLDKRGYSTAHERFDIRIPRDGGIQDLLAEARRPDRRFDAVICESIDRVARRTYYGTKVEHDLEADGVALFAADEPINLTGKKATTILTRRVKQGVAEWYVLETLEKSWDGFCEHTRQGWNVGRPPYGYRGDKIPHPVPAKRAEGKVKTKLAPDPITGPIVTAIFTWRVAEQLGYQAIVDRLNADPDRYPSPVSPDPARVRIDWTRSSIQDLLRNPKYTGYMVWNRRATKKRGQHNPPEQWIWSPEPTHEPLVTRDVFHAAQQVATRQGSRVGNEPNRHKATRRVYVLRSYVFCSCGRRMFGKTMRNRTTYYACQPTRNIGKAAADRHPGHANTVWVREDALLAGVENLLNERLFGDDRQHLLEQTLSATTFDQHAQRKSRRDALHKGIEQIAIRQDRLIATLESQDDPDGTVFGRVRHRLAELDRDRRAKTAELDTLGTEDAAPANDITLLDQLPHLSIDLAQLPDELQRELYDALQLQVRYDAETSTATGYVTLTRSSADFLATRGATATPLIADSEREQIHQLSQLKVGRVRLGIESTWTVSSPSGKPSTSTSPLPPPYSFRSTAIPSGIDRPAIDQPSPPPG